MIIVKFGCLIKEVTGNLVSIFFCNNFFNANSLPEPVTNNKIFLDDKIVLMPSVLPWLILVESFFKLFLVVLDNGISKKSKFQSQPGSLNAI